ncbi:MAG: efflux RND transporter periplasmic adaptor subunit [Runella sp.]
MALALFLVSCNNNSTSTTETPQETAPTELKLTTDQEKNFGITLGEAKTSEVYDEIVLNGSVETLPQQTASVSFQLSGVVKSIEVVAGSLIKKGGILATVESLELIQLQEEYWKTISQLTFANQERQRQATLSQEDIGAKRKLQQAETDYQTLEVTKQALEAKLLAVGLNPQSLQSNQIIRRLAITAPIGGSVEKIHANVGMSVKPGETLFEIINTTGARVVLKVFEKDIPRIQVGQTVKLESGLATITQMGNVFDVNTRSLNIYARTNARLLAGQFVTGKVEVAPRQAYVLPESAVVRTGETAHIFLKYPPNIYRPIDIKTGVSQNGFVEVIFTQKVALPIVLTGAQTLQAELTKGLGGED